MVVFFSRKNNIVIGKEGNRHRIAHLITLFVNCLSKGSIIVVFLLNFRPFSKGIGTFIALYRV